MDLPPELSWQILLQLPYQQIINYCQTNLKANWICLNESFWNDKAKLEFEEGIEYITGSTPAQRYHILREIYTSKAIPTQMVVELGQTEYFLHKGMDSGEVSLDNLIVAAIRGYHDIVRMIMQKEYDYPEDQLLGSLYVAGLENGYPVDELNRLQQMGPIDWRLPLEFLLEQEDPRLDELLQIQANPKQVLTDALLFHILNSDKPAETVEYALDHYPEYVDGLEVFQELVDDNPLLQRLVNEYQLKISQ